MWHVVIIFTVQVLFTNLSVYSRIVSHNSRQNLRLDDSINTNANNELIGDIDYKGQENIHNSQSNLNDVYDMNEQKMNSKYANGKVLFRPVDELNNNKAIQKRNLIPIRSKIDEKRFINSDTIGIVIDPKTRKAVGVLENSADNVEDDWRGNEEDLTNYYSDNENSKKYAQNEAGYNENSQSQLLNSKDSYSNSALKKSNQLNQNSDINKRNSVQLNNNAEENDQEIENKNSDQQNMNLAPESDLGSRTYNEFVGDEKEQFKRDVPIFNNKDGDDDEKIDKYGSYKLNKKRYSDQEEKSSNLNNENKNTDKDSDFHQIDSDSKNNGAEKGIILELNDASFQQDQVNLNKDKEANGEADFIKRSKRTKNSEQLNEENSNQNDNANSQINDNNFGLNEENNRVAHEKEIEQQIQAKINAINEQVKREIAASSQQKDVKKISDEKSDRSRRTLDSETNSDIDPNAPVNTNNLQAHIRKRRNPRTNYNPALIRRKRSGAVVPYQQSAFLLYRADNDEDTDEGNEFDDDGFDDRTQNLMEKRQVANNRYQQIRHIAPYAYNPYYRKANILNMNDQYENLDEMPQNQKSYVYDYEPEYYSRRKKRETSSRSENVNRVGLRNRNNRLSRSLNTKNRINSNRLNNLFDDLPSANYHDELTRLKRVKRSNENEQR